MKIFASIIILVITISSFKGICQTVSIKAKTVSPKGVCFNVLDYGALNNGKEDAAKGINAAIQAAKVAGGGTVYIPAGNYTCGPIALVSNLNLCISEGALMKFPVQNLPYVKGKNQEIECLTPVPLIGGRDLENVTISGGGTITTDNAAKMVSGTINV
jgi:polygalacturonase